jgi:hypothetical protein|nr:MAG TPA: hypothetical protein [Caudoviricetes sp.]
MYLINRIVCMSNNTRFAYNVELQTEDIEATRKELINLYQCDRICFEYKTIKEVAK